MGPTACTNCPRVRELESMVESLKAELESLRSNGRSVEEAMESMKMDNESLRKDKESLEEEKKELTRRVNMNSTNSSKPPSTDGYRKPVPKSLREISERRPGAQPGHAGSHAIIPHEPDEIIEHLPTRCVDCPNQQRCREESVFVCAESRKKIDFVITTKVTEHRCISAVCPMHSDDSQPEGRLEKGEFPEDVKAVVQYGDSFAALAGVLSTYGFMSYNRITSLLRDLTGTTISEGTIVSMVGRCAEAVEPCLKEIRERILNEKVINVDETGVHINGRIAWVHSTSTPTLMIQTVSRKRGCKGIDEHGIVPEFDGILVHDFWKSYLMYDVKHAFCCAHLLRELVGIKELEPDHMWVTCFMHLLLVMKRFKEAAQRRGMTGLGEDVLEVLHQRYAAIMMMADMECPPPRRTGQRGRPKMGLERSLIERLRTYEEGICLFAHDFDVPFDNNLAERDVRYVKVKMKVSGQYKDIEHAQKSLDIISYIGTARKNNVSAYHAMIAAFSGNHDMIFGQI